MIVKTGALRPYSKRKLELESNLSEVLPVICKVIHASTQNLIWKNSNLSTWSLAVSTKKNDKISAEKILCITRVRLIRVQLKFAFRIRPWEFKKYTGSQHHNKSVQLRWQEKMLLKWCVQAIQLTKLHLSKRLHHYYSNDEK